MAWRAYLSGTATSSGRNVKTTTTMINDLVLPKLGGALMVILQVTSTVFDPSIVEIGKSLTLTIFMMFALRYLDKQGKENKQAHANEKRDMENRHRVAIDSLEARHQAEITRLENRHDKEISRIENSLSNTR